MGEGQTLSVDQQLASAREEFENGRDFTVAVEEEFALLDRDTLALDNRFEQLQALAAGREVEAHLVGELIASEAEVRTGRSESFAEAAARMGERREQLSGLADELGVRLGSSGTHPTSE